MTTPAEHLSLRVVLDAEEARLAAMVTGDLATLGSLLSEECVYVHSSGATDTKQSYLAKLADGSIRYVRVRACEVRPVELGTAVVLAHVMYADAVVKGVPRILRNQAASVWQTVGDTVRLVYFQSTSLPEV
jgi:Domain of unknown function (DUF4440)